MQDDDPKVDAALAAWDALTPPPGFADSVLARRAVPAPVRRRGRWIAGAALVAAAAVAVVAWPAPRSAAGALTARARVTARLGDRGLAVAEADSELRWRVDRSGAAELEQPRGNVFYRVEHGEPFVVHTPAGDVRVTGTCFRIEVIAMTPTKKMLLSGLGGAALASAVLVTVYEGHVIAETRTAKTDVLAGARATMDGRAGTTLISDAIALTVDDEHASREQLIARTRQQARELAELRAKVAPPAAEPDSDDRPARMQERDPGRAWYDPSPETLAKWAADCRIRIDAPDVDHFEPATAANAADYHLRPEELADYNAAMTDINKQWRSDVRALYLEVTGDTAGADTLSPQSMQHEIEEKSAEGETNVFRQALARERAGLQAAPAELGKTSAYQRMMRAWAALGDQTEAALARRLGAPRAKELRGDGWDRQGEMRGCPK